MLLRKIFLYRFQDLRLVVSPAQIILAAAHVHGCFSVFTIAAPSTGADLHRTVPPGPPQRRSLQHPMLVYGATLTPAWQHTHTRTRRLTARRPSAHSFRHAVWTRFTSFATDLAIDSLCRGSQFYHTIAARPGTLCKHVYTPLSDHHCRGVRGGRKGLGNPYERKHREMGDPFRHCLAADLCTCVLPIVCAVPHVSRRHVDARRSCLTQELACVMHVTVDGLGGHASPVHWLSTRKMHEVVDTRRHGTAMWRWPPLPPRVL